MKQKFELTLTSDYAAQWGVQEALREILQNGIDQEQQIKNNHLDITYDGKDILTIANKNSVLLKETLLLGFSTKQNDDTSIGQFGEGYKIALLVLTRLNKKVTIYNYGKKEIWTSRFVKSKRYNGQKVLTITVNTEPIWKSVPNNNLTFEIQGINNLEYQELVSRALPLQKDYKKNIIETPKGQILLDKRFKCKVYVNGLYINTIHGLEYGYNIKPKYINIGRDRDLVSNYDIQKVTSAMWRNQTNNHLLYKMLKEQSADVSYITSSKYDETGDNFTEAKKELVVIRDNLLNDLKEQDGENVIPVKNQTELEEVKSRYINTKPVLVNSTIYEILDDSDKIHELKETCEKADLTVEEEFKIWKNKYYYEVLDWKVIKELDQIFNRLI